MERTIASKEGYTLTEKHFALYLKALEGYEFETDTKESEELIKLELKQAFLEDPQAILKELNALSEQYVVCLLYTSPSPRDKRQSRMPSSA